MKRTISILLLFCFQTAMAYGFDDILLNSKYSPGLELAGFSPENFCRKGIRGDFSHSNPYGLGSLSWDLASAQYGTGRWGVFGLFRSYRLDELYNNNLTRLGSAFSPNKSLAFSIALDYSREVFGGRVAYGRYDINLGASYVIWDAVLAGYIEGINIEKPYEFDGIDRAAFRLAGSYQLQGSIIISAGYQRNKREQSRWSFGQRIGLFNAAELKLGFMNNPNILNWGLDLSWKRFTLGMTYFAMSKLDNTAVLSLSYGVR